METLKTLAALKRLPIGTRARLVHCLMGPCDKGRTLALVQSDALAWKRDEAPDGPLSWLYLPKASGFAPTPTGFRIMEGAEIAAEYVLESEGSR